MDKYLKRKSVNENEKASNEKKSNSVMRHHSDSYILFGFTYASDLTFPKSVCFVCRKWLSNSAMVPAKMKRYLETNQSSLKNKNTNHFACFLKNNKKEMDSMNEQQQYLTL